MQSLKRVKINQFVQAKEGQSPLYAFENSLLLNRKQDALRNYNEIANKNNIQTSHYLQLLENLSFKKSLQVYNDYQQSRKPTDEMNELVVKNAAGLEFDDLKLVVEFISKIEKTEKVLNALLKVFGDFGLEKQQDELFALIVSKNYDLTETFKIMTFCLRSRVRKAEELVNGLNKQGLKVTSHHYLCLAEGFANIGDLQKTRKYFDKVVEMGDLNEKQKAYRALLECCAKRGLQKDSVEIYRDFRRKNLPATKDIYVELINNQLFTQDTTQALNWFHRTKPSAAMYSALIRVLLKKDSLTAFNYLKDLEKRNIPDELGLALFQNIAGKHPDYLKDHLKFARIQHKGKIYEAIIKQAYQNGKEHYPLINQLYTDLKSTESPTLPTSIIQLAVTGDKELFDSIITDGFEREAQIVYAYSLHQKNRKELFESVSTKQLNSDLMNLNIDLVNKDMIRESGVVIKSEHSKLMEIGGVLPALIQ